MMKDNVKPVRVGEGTRVVYAIAFSEGSEYVYARLHCGLDVLIERDGPTMTGVEELREGLPQEAVDNLSGLSKVVEKKSDPTLVDELNQSSYLQREIESWAQEVNNNLLKSIDKDYFESLALERDRAIKQINQQYNRDVCNAIELSFGVGGKVKVAQKLEEPTQEL
jgi:hypothetical protein